jgi:plastocyanin
MQNTIIAIVLALVVLGGGYYYFMGSPTPAAPTEDTAVETPVDSGMPVPEAGNEGTTEMEVSSSTTSTEAGAGAAAAPATAGAVKSFTVEGSNMKFVPSTMEVKKGDTVKITFKNVDGFHDFVIDEFKVKTKQIKSPSEETVEFVADKAGSFEYYCSVGKHREMGMKGTLTVKE